ncbi:hypothetical protein MTO96_012703 [Rhipicephalus appendiculatus]
MNSGERVHFVAVAAPLLPSGDQPFRGAVLVVLIGGAALGLLQTPTFLESLRPTVEALEFRAPLHLPLESATGCVSAKLRRSIAAFFAGVSTAGRVCTL